MPSHGGVREMQGTELQIRQEAGSGGGFPPREKGSSEPRRRLHYLPIEEITPVAG